LACRIAACPEKHRTGGSGRTALSGFRLIEGLVRLIERLLPLIDQVVPSPTAAAASRDGIDRQEVAEMAYMATRRELGAMIAAQALLGGTALAAPASAPLAWRKLLTEPYRGKQDDIAFVDPDHGWFGNGQGKLYATRDGGES
jgi:hypothetical protein